MLILILGGARSGRALAQQLAAPALRVCYVATLREEAPAEGYRIRSALAGYIHPHFGFCPALAERFVDSCAAWRSGRSK